MPKNPNASGITAAAIGPNEAQRGYITIASLTPLKLQSDVEINAYAHQNIPTLTIEKNSTATYLLACARLILALCVALSIVCEILGKPNVELTGAAWLYRAASRERSERG